MFRRLNHRFAHLALLTAVWALLCLPNLGGPSLWDIDEGNNAECGREMLQSGNHVVPNFNYDLREDKPAGLYRLQIAAYLLFGVNEFAARLPSALAALLTILATYELGRQTFGKRAGLLAGLILATAIAFSAAAHFANPDALLTAFTTLTLLVFWDDCRRNGRGWLFLTGATTGIAVLVKGPVGLVLPMAVTHLFLIWRRQWLSLVRPGAFGGCLLFAAVAVPWYIWVGLETKGLWLLGFWEKHHAARMTTALENHKGPVYYYLLILIAGLVPWSIFFGPTAWHAWRQLRQRVAGAAPEQGEGHRPAVQFLVCWLAVYVVFFSLVQTKLPNYILPAYPAVALLVAFFLDQWRRGQVAVPSWVVPTSLACLALIGAGVVVGLLIAGGAIEVPALRGKHLPGLEALAGLGGVLVGGALAGWWCARRDQRGGVIATVAIAGVLFTSGVGIFGVEVVDRYKAPRAMAQALPADQLYRDVRIGAYEWFRPSIVFYCQREVARLECEEQALELLEGAFPAYLFVPADVWEKMEAKTRGRYRLVARHHDLYGGRDVVVVSNE